MNGPAVKVQNLSWRYNGTNVLDSINISITHGSINGVLGPNGAGKTTFLRLILKLIKPEKHTIFIHESDVLDLSSMALARETGYVPQTMNVNFGFTVQQIVAMGRNPHLKRFEGESKKDKSIIQSAMEETEVYYLKDKAINQISGGELQRVIIARALAQEPDILVLDEPTNHLDLNHQIRILSLVKSLSRKKNITVIAVMHDFNHALEFCDNLFMINNGKIEAWGRPEEVITPEIMKRVYQLEVKLQKNPFTGRPYMINGYKQEI